MESNVFFHPLHHKDRIVVDRVLAVTEPTTADIVDVARLMNRYQGFLGDQSTWNDLIAVADRWHMSRDSLNRTARRAWSADFKPDSALLDVKDAIGSGSDVDMLA